MMFLNQASESLVLIIGKKKEKKIPRPYPTHHKSLVGRSQDATFGISFPNDSQPIKV